MTGGWPTCPHVLVRVVVGTMTACEEHSLTSRWPDSKDRLIYAAHLVVVVVSANYHKVVFKKTTLVPIKKTKTPCMVL